MCQSAGADVPSIVAVPPRCERPRTPRTGPILMASEVDREFSEVRKLRSLLRMRPCIRAFVGICSRGGGVDIMRQLSWGPQLKGIVT